MSTDEENTDKMIESKPKMASRFSSLPEMARQDSVVQNHTDKLGNVDMGGVAAEAALTRKNYKILSKAFIAAVFLIFLLVLSTFGVSLAAAILAKDTQVGSSSGTLMVKNGSGERKVVKTQEAVKDVVYPNIPGMSFEELRAMKKFALAGNGDDTGLELDVKGVSKSADGHVTLVVEGGGTIVFNSEGIFDATGIAKTLLASVLQMDSLDIADGDDFRRALFSYGAYAGLGGPVPGSLPVVPMVTYPTGSAPVNLAYYNDPEGKGKFYFDCCIPGYNDETIQIVDEGELTTGLHSDECSDLCHGDSDCTTSDLWGKNCYLQSVDASYARPYPGCTMFVKNGGGVPNQCLD